MTEAIAFEGVRKTYGRVVAVDRVDFQVAPGTFVGLIGHNGAGKSTCLKMLMGLVHPTGGRVRVLGAVPEEPAVYEWLSCREFLEFVAAVRGAGDVGRALEVSGLGQRAAPG